MRSDAPPGSKHLMNSYGAQWLMCSLGTTGTWNQGCMRVSRLTSLDTHDASCVFCWLYRSLLVVCRQRVTKQELHVHCMLQCSRARISEQPGNDSSEIAWLRYAALALEAETFLITSLVGSAELETVMKV